MNPNEPDQHRNAVYRHSLQGVILGLLLVLVALALTFPYLPDLLAAMPPVLRLVVMVLFVFLMPTIMGFAGHWLGTRLETADRKTQALQRQITLLHEQQQEKQPNNNKTPEEPEYLQKTHTEIHI